VGEATEGDRAEEAAAALVDATRRRSGSR